MKGNEKADDLAKQALNFNVLILKVPYTDLKVNVNSVFKQKWHAQWNACPDNKLYIPNKPYSMRFLCLDWFISYGGNSYNSSLYRTHLFHP